MTAEAQNAMRRYVVGIDSSTQSTKAIAWDAEGRVAAEGRASVELSQPQPGYAEQDCEDWWRALSSALQQVVSVVGADAIDAVAISNQRETVAFLDASGRAIRPAMVWLDERAITTYADYADRMGREWLHRTTGKPIDTIPVVYRLDWLRRNDPAILDACARVTDVHAFLTGRLTGEAASTWSSADPFGIFDINTMDWSHPILDSVGVRRDQLPALVRPGSLIGQVKADSGTGLAAGTPVFGAGGDGQCAGLGTNAFQDGTVYLNLGTATVTGVYSATPAIDLNWRTMTGPTGDGYFLEALQKAGAFFVNWVVDSFAGGRADAHAFDRLEAEASALPIGSDGVTMTPHIVGVMNPDWDPSARAAIVGLSSHHGRAHIYRAALEALTCEIMRGIAAMGRQGLSLQRIRAIGGGANSRLWLQMLADATRLPIELSMTVEASSLGAGIVAAVGAGWFADYQTSASAMTTISSVIEPRPEHFASWAMLCERQAGIYGNTSSYGIH